MDKDVIHKIIKDIFTQTNCELSTCDFSNEGGILWCLIETPDSRYMIGRDGETLKSLNHIVRKIAEKSLGENNLEKLFIDVNGYYKKHFDSLKSLAHMMAERARYFKSNIEVDPMPAHDRRIIHMFLEGAQDIKTESEGSGLHRRVVIKYTPEEKI